MPPEAEERITETIKEMLWYVITEDNPAIWGISRAILDSQISEIKNEYT